MITRPFINSKKEPHFLIQLQDGDEGGLNYFYRKLYPKLAWWALKRVKDDVAASSITHEAFLKLWLLRENIVDSSQLMSLLHKQINQGCKDFYQKTSMLFQRSMIKLDDIENYQEFMGGYGENDSLEDMDMVYQQELDKEKKLQWAAIERVMPSMSEDQQLFIKLCLQYSFSYDRIAWHLGGISNYEVARRIERTIESLKSVMVGSRKLEVAGRAKSFSFEGGLTDEQANILNLRYEMKFSFEEIATSLGLSQNQVQRTFVQAYSAMKKANKLPAKAKLT